MKRLEETVVRLDQDPRVVIEMGLAFVLGVALGYAT
jgi:hypothetical protein